MGIGLNSARLAITAAFLLAVPAIGDFTFLVKKTVRDAQGRILVVVQARDRSLKLGGEKFSLIVRYQGGKVDPTFGKQGVVTLRNWESWNQVEVSDVKFTSSGELVVLGILASEDRALPTPGEQRLIKQLQDPSADQETLRGDTIEWVKKHAQSVTGKDAPDAREYFRSTDRRYQKAHASHSRKLFVSKFDASGQLLPEFGEGGTAIVSGILNRVDDTPESLALSPSGTIAFLAIQSGPQRHKTDESVVVGRLNGQGQPVPGNRHFGRMDFPRLRGFSDQLFYGQHASLFFEGEDLNLMVEKQGVNDEPESWQAREGRSFFRVPVAFPPAPTTSRPQPVAKVTTQQPFDSLEIHGSDSADGRHFYLFTGGERDSFLRLYDLSQGQLLKKINFSHSTGIQLRAVIGLSTNADGTVNIFAQTQSDPTAVMAITLDRNLQIDGITHAKPVFDPRKRGFECTATYEGMVD